MEDDYSMDCVGGSLKLKQSHKQMKKAGKRKKKGSNKRIEPIREENISKDNETTVPEIKQVKTAAELAFEKAQHQRTEARIKKKAQTSHREQVEKLNEKLENLTEHYDIPKVSWTK